MASSETSIDTLLTLYTQKEHNAADCRQIARKRSDPGSEENSNFSFSVCALTDSYHGLPNFVSHPVSTDHLQVICLLPLLH